jgi:multiple sugar transport system substrate-binding protein
MKKSRTIRWAALAATTAVTAALAGCAGGGGGGGAAGGEDGSLEGQKIVYWASNQGSSVSMDEEVLGESIDRFTEATGVEVELEVIPWPDLYNRILAAVSSGEGPDVLNIGNTWAVPLQSSGAFIPWEGEALEAIGGQDRFVETSWATGGAEGQAPTSVPLYGLAYSLYYNTALFEEAGITEPPATWDEFVETAKKLTKDTDGDGETDQWGFTLAGQRVSNNAHQAFVRGLQNGGELYTEDGKPDFANDGVVTGVKQWLDLMGEDGVVAPSNAEINDGSVLPTELIEGRAAMMFDQAAGKTFAAADFEDFDVAPIPMNTADATGLEGTQSHVAGINVSVFANSENKDAAIAFVKHLTSDEEQKTLNAAYTSLPVVTSAMDDPAFDTPEMSAKKVTYAEHSQPMPLYPSEGQMETLVGEAIGKLFAKIAQGDSVSEDDVRAALEDAQAQMPAS